MGGCLTCGKNATFICRIQASTAQTQSAIALLVHVPSDGCHAQGGGQRVRGLQRLQRYECGYRQLIGDFCRPGRLVLVVVDGAVQLVFRVDHVTPPGACVRFTFFWHVNRQTPDGTEPAAGARARAARSSDRRRASRRSSRACTRSAWARAWMRGGDSANLLCANAQPRAKNFRAPACASRARADRQALRARGGALSCPCALRARGCARKAV